MLGVRAHDCDAPSHLIRVQGLGRGNRQDIPWLACVQKLVLHGSSPLCEPFFDTLSSVSQGDIIWASIIVREPHSPMVLVLMTLQWVMAVTQLGLATSESIDRMPKVTRQ